MALKSSNKVDTNVYEIEVTVAPEEFTQACKDAYLKRRKSIQLPGFRKGKATQGMIEKLYGEGFFYEDALEIVYPAVVTAAIEEAGLRTVDSPAELDVNSFVSLLSPKGVDAAVRDKIRSDVVAVLQDPQVKEKFSTFAFQPMSFTVPEMQQFARKKSEQYKLLIEKAQISLD